MTDTNNEDLQGNAYLLVSDATVGLEVQVDGDFTCIRPHARRVIKTHAQGIWIRCTAGKHFLDGQLSDDGTAYVGVYKVKPA
jgi:hypothetical protein